jgi:outer membrane protein
MEPKQFRPNFFVSIKNIKTMKKTLITLGLLTHFLGEAQTEKGSWMVGGNASFSAASSNMQVQNAANSGNSSQNLNFNVLLNGGYFVRKQVAVGLLGGYSFFSSSNTSDGSNYSNTSTGRGDIFSLGFFARGYKLIPANKLAFFCQLEALYQTGRTQSENTSGNGSPFAQSSTINSDLNGYSATLRPGLVYFITPRIGIETTFGALSYTDRTQSTTFSGAEPVKNKSTSLTANFGLNSLFFGVHFYFGAKEKQDKIQ